MMFNILQSAIPLFMFLICLKWGDWKNSRKYYPTILYVIVWSLLYSFLYVNHPLWMFKHNTIRVVLIAFVTYPSVILLYLPYVSKKSIVKQILQIAFWTFLLSLIEATLIATHRWSVGFNGITFSMIRLHYENSLLAWPISVLLFLITMIIFKLPINSLL